MANMQREREKEEKKLINPDYVYAIVGASNHREKYGYKVLIDFREGGYKVIPINPNAKEICGLKVYPTLSNYYDKNAGEKIDIVVFVVPAPVTEYVLKEVRKLGIAKVWLQPGSESPQAIKYCEDNKINCAHNMCIMVMR